MIADDCGTADALATAFMVIGVDSAKVLLKKIKGIDAYFIYGDQGAMKTYATEGIKKILVK